MKFAPHRLCTGYKKITILQKKKKKKKRKRKEKQKNNKKNVVPLQNGDQITEFIYRHFDFGQTLNKHFPKRIFQENLAQSRRI